METVKISNITHPDGAVREDGRYPLRINCVAEIMEPFDVGLRMWLGYIYDGEGNEKFGALVTSCVRDIDYDDDENTYIVTTQNSV